MRSRQQHQCCVYFSGAPARDYHCVNRPVCRSSLSVCLISTQIARSGDENLIDLGQTMGIEKGSVPKQNRSDEIDVVGIGWEDMHKILTAYRW